MENYQNTKVDIPLCNSKDYNKRHPIYKILSPIPMQENPLNFYKYLQVYEKPRIKNLKKKFKHDSCTTKIKYGGNSENVKRNFSHT